MKVVIDTNVLVSGLISAAGPCGQIVGLVAEDAIQPCVDDRILHEYERVLPRPRFQIEAEHVSDTLELIRARAEILTPMPLSVTLPDPDDLPFLEVAAACGALLVTGNTRHFPKRARAGVTVLTPAEFLDLLGS